MNGSEIDLRPVLIVWAMLAICLAFVLLKIGCQAIAQEYEIDCLTEENHRLRTLASQLALDAMRQAGAEAGAGSAA